MTEPNAHEHAPTTPEASPGPESAREEVRLSREMTLFDATMLGVGALMGGGVFVLVGLGSEAAGPAVILAFALNALATLPTLLIYAELGSAFDDAGGGYLWVKDALKQPWGFLGGWVGWFSHAVACAVYTLASSAYFLRILEFAGALEWLTERAPAIGAAVENGVLLKLVAVAFTLLFVWLNFVGVKSSIKTENAITTIVLLIVGAFIFFGFRAMGADPDAARANFSDFMPLGLSGLAVAMGLTFLAFEGYEIIAQSSEEVKNPRRNIPLAIKLSLFIVAPIYILVTIVAIGATILPDMPSWRFLGDGGELALVEGAQRFVPYGFLLLGAGALLTNLTALNATIYSSSRVSFAMGRDGNLPRSFSRIHPKRRTPHLSIWSSGAIILLMAVTLPIGQVAAASEILFLLLFVLVNVSYIKLRHTVPKERFGYRAPLFPLLPVLGIAFQLFLIVVLLDHARSAALFIVAALAAGIALYYAFARPREAIVEKREVAERTVHAHEARERRDYRILVPVANPAFVHSIATVARELAKGLHAEVHLLYVVTVPRPTLPSEGRAFVKDALPVLRQAEAVIGPDVPVHSLVRIGHEVPSVIREVAEEKGATLLLLGWRGVGRLREAIFGSTIDDLVENPPCDVGVLKMREVRSVRHVLIPTHGGAHAPLSIRLGTAIGRAASARVTLYNVVSTEQIEEISEESRMARGRGLLAANALPGADVALDLEYADTIVPTVVRKAKSADLVIIGASTEPVWRNYLFGHKTEQLADALPAAVLMVKAHQGPTAHSFRSLARRLKAAKRYLRRA